MIAPRLVGGWWLPGKDSYFDRYVEGDDKKQNGFQREHLLEAFKYVRNWRVAIDVGAHIGFWAKDMAERFERVYCFEAAQDTFSCLVKNMAEYPNVVCTNVAIGDKPGECSVNEDTIRKGNTGARYVTKGGSTAMMSLDRLNMLDCDFLKVDVEGFESMVLRGAKGLIERERPVISMETDKKFAAARYHIANTEAEHFLLKRGYHVAAHMRPDKVFVPDDR